MNIPKVTPEYLAELHKLANAATMGPWDIISRLNNEHYLVGVLLAVAEVSKERNAKFIAASRTAIPALLDHIEKLEKMMPHTLDTCKHGDTTSYGYGCKADGGMCRYSYCWNGKWEMQ